MQPLSISMLTVCGLEELSLHARRGVTHVLSILDPSTPEPEAFLAYDRHHRMLLRFHDEIEPRPGILLPTAEDVKAVLTFNERLSDRLDGAEQHLLVHCHAGISRSTAAMAMLLAQLHPEVSEDDIFAHVVGIRPKAWPNSRMIGFADAQLGRGGRFTAALGRLYARQLVAFPFVADFMREHWRSRELEMAAAA